MAFKIYIKPVPYCYEMGIIAIGFVNFFGLFLLTSVKVTSYMPYKHKKLVVLPLFLSVLLICLYLFIPIEFIDLIISSISKGVYLLLLAIMFFLGCWANNSPRPPKTEKQKLDVIVYAWAFVGLFSVMIEW